MFRANAITLLAFISLCSCEYLFAQEQQDPDLPPKDQNQNTETADPVDKLTEQQQDNATEDSERDISEMAEPASTTDALAAENENFEISAIQSLTSGEGGLGLIVNSGNTNNESFNGNIKINHESGKWLHKFALSGKQVKEENITTAKRYLFTEQTDYTFTNISYAFLSLRFDDDRFDGFDYQSSITSGIGWHIMNSELSHLDVQLGLGPRRNKETETGKLIEETISRFSQHYDSQLTDSTSLSQDLLVESGNTNTTSELNLGLKVTINSDLALKVSYNVKHHSKPPATNEATDRATSITLVFGFQ